MGLPIGSPSTVILTARKETSPRTVLKVIQHGHAHPSVHLFQDRGANSCRCSLQGAALAYTAALFCPSICYKVPEPRPPIPLPGSFREISICMLAQSRSMPHASLQPKARGAETGPEIFMSFFVTLLNLFGYLNKQKLQHA